LLRPDETRSFLFNAHGHALSAQFHQPFVEVVDAQAAVSLPITGGHGSARSDNFRFKEVISFKSAYSHVSGSRNFDGSHATMITTVVEGLNILDVVSADRIVARISSHHGERDPEPRITLVGSKFENLRVLGEPVKIKLDCHTFSKYDTYSGFTDAYEKETAFRQEMNSRFLWTHDGLASHEKQNEKRNPGSKKATPDFITKSYGNHVGTVAPDWQGKLHCSLVESLEPECPVIECYGHILIVPQFGRIFLAELFLEKYARRLVMVRAELGCSIGGRVIAADGTGNGSSGGPPGHG
jgi:hypothetical protein